MKTKELQKVKTAPKDRIGHPFKDAPYRNLDMSQQPEIPLSLIFGSVLQLRCQALQETIVSTECLFRYSM